MGEDSASSSSSPSISDSGKGRGRGGGGSAGSSDAPCHGAAGPLIPSLSFSCVPRLGEVPVFDLMTSPQDWAGAKGVSVQLRIWAALQ